MNFCNVLVILGYFIIKSRKLDSQPICNMTIVETIPTNLTYDSQAPAIMPIWKAWSTLINSSKKRIRIASFYWTMLNNDVINGTRFPSSNQGEEIFRLLLEKSKTIPLEIVQNGTSETHDLSILKKNNLVKIYYLNIPKFLHKGIQHAKVWIGDETAAFVGSANMDWRAVAEIKELGIYIPNCTEIVKDIDKFWQTLQFLTTKSRIPSQWPPNLLPVYNHTHPFLVYINGVLSKSYIATSPPAFNPPHRTSDLTALIRTITRAKRFIHIAVMDFLPLYVNYHNRSKFWPDIENYLIAAAINNQVSVKLLISLWKYSNPDMLNYLRALEQLSAVKGVSLKVKVFIVPAFKEYQRKIPYSRVSHSKYMVTDQTAYIGTSNWSGDYFNSTGGMSFVSEEVHPDSNNRNSIRTTLEEIFKTDWNSIYSHDLN